MADLPSGSMAAVAGGGPSSSTESAKATRKRLEARNHRKAHKAIVLQVPKEERMFYQAERVVAHKIRKNEARHYCLTCWRNPRYCLCDLVLPRLSIPNVVISVQIHYREFMRGSNTAKLIGMCLEGTEVFLSGVRDDEARLQARIAQYPNTSVVLFPSTNCVKFSQFLEEYTRKPHDSSVNTDDASSSSTATSTSTTSTSPSASPLPTSDAPATGASPSPIVTPPFAEPSEAAESPSSQTPPVTPNPGTSSAQNGAGDGSASVGGGGGAGGVSRVISASHFAGMALPVETVRSDSALASWRGDPMHVIVVDGTWGNAKSLNKRLGPALPRLVIEAKGPSILDPVRHQSTEDRICTFEALIYLLEDMGLTAAASELLLAKLKVSVDMSLHQQGAPLVYGSPLSRNGQALPPPLPEDKLDEGLSSDEDDDHG